MDECGGCKRIGAHRRHCVHNPTYTLWRELADAAKNLGDRVGSNNMEAANHLYRAAGLLMQQHRERTTE